MQKRLDTPEMFESEGAMMTTTKQTPMRVVRVEQDPSRLDGKNNQIVRGKWMENSP